MGIKELREKKMDDFNEVFVTENPKPEVMQKHKSPFSKSNARRNTRTASDLVAEINSRRSSQRLENVGIIMPLNDAEQNSREQTKKHLKFDLETQFLNRLFGDIQSSDYIFLAVGALVTIFVIASDTLFCFLPDRSYQEKLLPWHISLSSILVVTLVLLLIAWCQLRNSRTLFLIVTAELTLFGFFLAAGLAYSYFLRITKKWELVEFAMSLSLALSSLAFLLLSYVVYQVQYVVRRLLYNAEIHAFDTENGRISMINQL